MVDLRYDVPPDAPVWGHRFGPGAEGVRLHYTEEGEGRPVLLLHGWPGFWYDWRRVIPLLTGEFRVLAPDLRGFGDSDRPPLPPEEGYTTGALARDVLALLEALDLRGVLLGGHDIGALVAQAVARRAPDRVAGLVLANPPYPGIGERFLAPAVQREAWYQHFHALPWSHRLIGHSRETVALYLAHFYDRWVARKEAVRPAELDFLVDVYARPGAVEFSIAWYRAQARPRREGGAPDPSALRVPQPTFVLWGEEDPVLRVEWADRLGEFFPRLVGLERLPGVGHFVPLEAPASFAEGVRRVARTVAGG